MNQTTIWLAIGALLLQFVPSKVWCNEFSIAQRFNQDQSADNVEDRKLVLIVKLDEENINQIRRTGVLKTKIPKNLRNRVAAIRFQGPTSFLDKPVVIESNVDKQNRLLTVKMDDSILDRIDYQPIEFKIYYSGWDGLSLVYDAQGQVAGTLPATPVARDFNDSPIVFVRINSKRGIFGSVKNLKTLSIKTSFGDTQIPTTQIAGIRFDKENKQRVQVILKQGDVISGVFAEDKLIVKSRWGEKELDLADIESITPTRDSRFVPAPESPGKWRLQSTIAKEQLDSQKASPSQTNRR